MTCRRSPFSPRVMRALSLSVLVAVLGIASAPALVGAADSAPCASDCAGSDGDKHCPPTCAQGPCAKSAPVVPAAVADFSLPELVAGAVGGARVGTVDSPAPRGVFHPPRA